ncbi:MAG TPA: ATP-dependent RNA helicase HrpA [Syntrophales bacterium]|nr:ATP-dependent RNA helicase HrpA [Syntrophales bacterium]
MEGKRTRINLEEIRRKIRKSMPEIMASDRIHLSGVLERLDREKARGIPAEKLLSLYAAAGERLERSRRQRERRREAVPRFQYPDNLPITAEKRDITASIRKNPVTIVTGQTGSGKSTQIPKMCLEAGRGASGLIGHTQPRRIAAVAVANRIAEELGEPIGRSVGYKIRFEEKVGSGAFIKLMTDGILLAEIQGDPLLRLYDTIIIDEAHERSLNIDLILGLLRNLLRRRKDLKVVITSATIDAKKFSRAFGRAPVIDVSGRMYPVEVRYSPLDPGLEEAGDFTFIDAAVNEINRIREESASGDVLVFMPTERDIRETCERLEGSGGKKETVLPLFSRLTQSAQRQIFLSSPKRKIIVATNIAETSITIPGIRYVVDTGIARISRYVPRTRTFGLPIAEISRSSADQRKGRCGRIENGVCIRLYSEENFNQRPLFTSPEILRSNLAEVILRMLSLGISDAESFPFIDPPEARSIRDGFDLLNELGAIHRKEGETAWELTDRGRIMARLPIDPRVSRMLLEASAEGCLGNVLIIAAALSIMDPREWPPERMDEAKRAHEPFKDTSSDFLTLLNIWNRYHGAMEALRTQSRMRKFCREHLLSFTRMREWIEVHDQIRDILDESGISAKAGTEDDYYDQREGIHRSILSGSLSNIAVKKEKNFYQAAKGRKVMIFPGSGLFNRGGNWIMAAEMVETTRIYARTAANIDSAWIEPLAEGLCRYSCSDPHWDRGRGEVVAREQVSLFGLIIVPGRKVSFGRIDPEQAAAIFIRSALVEADVEKAPSFLEHNMRLIEDISRTEEKLRRRDLLVSKDELAEFYRKRLDAVSGPVFDLRTLEKLIRAEGGDGFLRMKPGDIMCYTPGEESLREYPDHFYSGRLRLPLQYSFQPGKPEDGVTVKIPLPALPSVRAEAADWLVPGLLAEKITCLIKGLPKHYRKALIPVPGTVETILDEMPRRGPLLTVLGEFIRERFGVAIPASAWNPEGLPEHLKMRYSVTAGGKELQSGRNLADLQKNTSDSAEDEYFEKARRDWERSGLASWDFQDLPQAILLGTEDDPHGFAFPALVENGNSVDIRLFRQRQEAEAAHRKGVVALFSARFKKELTHLRKNASLPSEMKQWALYFGGEKELERFLYERMLRELFDAPVRRKSDFERHAQAAAPKILPCGQEVLNGVRPVLKSYHDARTRLRTLEDANRSIRTVSSFLADIRSELDLLVPRDFALRYTRERLRRLPVYMSALLERAERGLLHLEKDRIKNVAVKTFEERCEAIAGSVDPASSSDKVKAIEEFRWMLQEYRISVFAPKIRTLYPVSPKRLERKLEEISSMQ